PLLPRGAFAFLGLGRFHLHVTRRLPEAAQALVEAMQCLFGAEPLIRVELARLHLACARPRAALAQAERALACRGEGGFPDALRLAADLAGQPRRLGDAARPLGAPGTRLSFRIGHNPKKGKTQAEALRRVE